MRGHHSAQISTGDGTLLFVGIDVAKHKHDIAIIDGAGEVLKSHLHIKNNRAGFELLDQTLKKRRNVFKEEMIIAMEDTGICSINLVQFLQSRHYMVYTYNLLLIKNLPGQLPYGRQKPIKRCLDDCLSMFLG